jgi:hypothetical protein
MIGLSALLLFPVLLPPQTPPPAPPLVAVLNIELRSVRADGKGFGSAGDNGADAFSSYLTALDTLCGFGAYSTLPVDPGGSVWKIGGEILSRNGDTFTVKVTWVRLWDRGALIQSPAPHEQVLTLRMGEHVTLETMSPSLSSPCGANAAQLEASIGTRPAWQARGGGVAGARANAVAAPAPAGPPIDAEMWLVLRKPDGSEASQRIVVHATPAGASYAFAPMAASTSNGKATVTVTGNIRPVIADGAIATIAIRIDRRVTVENAPTLSTIGNSMLNLPVPSPGEVLALEIPHAPIHDPLEGQQVSVRMRVLR